MYELNVEIQANSRRFTFTTPSGTTHSESKMKKSSENQRFSELFFFVHHGKIRQNKAQTEILVHLLKRRESSVKISGV